MRQPAKAYVGYARCENTSQWNASELRAAFLSTESEIEYSELKMIESNPRGRRYPFASGLGFAEQRLRSFITIATSWTLGVTIPTNLGSVQFSAMEDMRRKRPCLEFPLLQLTYEQ